MIKKYLRFVTLIAAALLVGVDQLTKWLALTYIKPVGTVSMLKFGETEWLNLTFVKNYGAAFSILQNKQTFLIIITSIVIVGVIGLMVSNRVKKPSYLWSFSLIVAGGIGNLIDRIANGFVIDFIDFRIINFAVFNFADICAVVGTGALIVFVLIDEVKSYRDEKRRKLEDTAEKAEEQNEG